MSDVRIFLERLLTTDGSTLSSAQKNLLDALAIEEQYMGAYQQIKNIQEAVMRDLQLKIFINDVLNSHLVIPNAMVGKPYEAVLKLDLSNPEMLEILAWEGLEELGLTYDATQNLISGTPNQSGDTQISFLFKANGEPGDSPLHKKSIRFFINADPKSLWKDIPSDQTALYAKEDVKSVAEYLGTKQIVAVSKRGRAHQNTGAFREDDLACAHYPHNGWSVVAVADGAGSYPLSRIGSEKATEATIRFFGQEEGGKYYTELEALLAQYNEGQQEDLIPSINNAAKQWMYESTKAIFQTLKDTAAAIETDHPELLDKPKIRNAIEYLHSTLVFTLFKKYEFGYVVLSFGVGDCPVALMDKDLSTTTLLNSLDVGEFGGGTRFITQNDIFHSNEIPMQNRFSVTIISDFAYLFLMTDGIYDPKFGVEAQLERHDQWLALLSDLGGNNDTGTVVDFERPENVAGQLSQWMDFWSVGNHDDRTLAIIY